MTGIHRPNKQHQSLFFCTSICRNISPTCFPKKTRGATRTSPLLLNDYEEISCRDNREGEQKQNTDRFVYGEDVSKTIDFGNASIYASICSFCMPPLVWRKSVLNSASKEGGTVLRDVRNNTVGTPFIFWNILHRRTVNELVILQHFYQTTLSLTNYCGVSVFTWV